jgi:hypothetical protein
MKNHTDTEDWNRLIWALADGEISEADKIRLDAILRNEPEARKLYVRNIAMESLLQWENSSTDLLDEKPIESSSPLIPFGQWFGGFARMPIAAAVALGIGLAAYFVLKSVDNGPILAAAGEKDEAKDALDVVSLDSLRNDPSVTEIDLVAGLTITTERNERGELLQRVYFPEAQQAPVPKTIRRPIEESVEGLAGFDENELLVEAAYPIEILESGQGFAAEGRIEVRGDIAAWHGEDALITSFYPSSLPVNGNKVIKFPTPVASSSQIAESTEILRVIDVRKLGDHIAAHKVTARTSARFNQASGLADEGTAYALRLHAIDREEGENRAIGRELTQLVADHDPATWQSVESEIDLPAGTDYLVLSISVRKEGVPQVLFANIGGSYADAVNLSMEVDGRPVYGTL